MGKIETLVNMGERLRLVRLGSNLSLSQEVQILRLKEGVGSKAHIENIELGNEGISQPYLNSLERALGIEPNTTLYNSCNYLTRQGIGEPAAVLRDWNVTPGYNRWLGYDLSGKKLDTFIFEQAAKISQAWEGVSCPTPEAYQGVSEVAGTLSINVIQRAQKLALSGQTDTERVLDYYALRQTLIVIRRLQRKYPEASQTKIDAILQEGLGIGRRVLASLDGRMNAKTLAPRVQTRIFQRGKYLISKT